MGRFAWKNMIAAYDQEFWPEIDPGSKGQDQGTWVIF